MRFNTRSILVLLIGFWLVFQPFAASAQLQQPPLRPSSDALLLQAEATPIVDETPETGARPDIGPDSLMAAEEVPYPIVNDAVATTDVEVLHGWSVRLSNSETSLTGTFFGECSGEPSRGWGNNFSYTYADDAAIWVQAKARDSDVVGPCIKVSWVEDFSQREAPWLTLGGFDADLTVDASTGVGIRYPDGAEASYFPDAACLDNSEANWISDPSGIYLPGGGEPRVTYWMARWIDEPDIASRCYRLEWSPDSGPNLLLNGDAMDTSTPIGSSVAFTYPKGAEVALFSTEGCTGPVVQDWGEHTAYVADQPTQLWVKARWSNYPELESTCFAMAWIAPTIPATPDATPSPEVTGTPILSPTPALPTATATQPAETSTPVTETPVTKVTSIRFEMSDGSSIEGAPWQLYAPSASQIAVAPYLDGTVGANNSIEFTDLPAGMYQLAVQPTETIPQTFMIEIGDESEEVVLQIDASRPTTATVVPTATVTQPTVADGNAGVTGLPSTGSGGESQTAVILFSTLAALLAMFGSFWRKSTRS